MAVVAVPILLWIALSGAFGDMLEQVFGYARSGVGGGGGRFWHVPAPALWVLGVIGCAVAMRDARLRRVAIPALLWIVVAWARVKVANYSYSHHYYPALPGIAAGIAVGIGSLWRRSLLERVAICALVLAAPLWSEVLRFQGHGLREPATLRFYKTASHPYHLVYPVSAFIRAHTSPSDTIYMAGGLPSQEATGAPGVYWLADRFSATRFIDTPPESLGALRIRGRAAVGADDPSARGDRAHAAVQGRPRPARRPPPVPLPAGVRSRRRARLAARGAG